MAYKLVEVFLAVKLFKADSNVRIKQKILKGRKRLK